MIQTNYSMNKKFLIIPVIVIITLAVVLGSNENKKDDKTVFHVTLASPNQYQNGVYLSNFEINPGEYRFRFVPNGDSPQRLNISLEGKKFQFSEEFLLNGTAHKTGISEYFTWDYNGKKLLNVSEHQELKITINPNGNVIGPVSIILVENEGRNPPIAEH